MDCIEARQKAAIVRWELNCVHNISISTTRGKGEEKELNSVAY